MRTFSTTKHLHFKGFNTNCFSKSLLHYYNVTKYQMSSHLHLHPAALFSWWNPSNWSWPTEFGAPQSWAWCWSGLPAGSPPHKWCSSHWHCVGCSPKSAQKKKKKTFWITLAAKFWQEERNLTKNQHKINLFTVALFYSVPVKSDGLWHMFAHSPHQDASPPVGLWSLGWLWWLSLLVGSSRRKWEENFTLRLL